ncbi:hypothetical protein EZV61_03965 [Corallincola luteus]|uniref:STAS/SEC14 domain-containing protein n=1 Tax=Corallincola luteus TaxID=1775177 RepID=A0ABY2APK4_9GAMM|nr:hypothetical protein [Corallincola luteus]TCI05126.1 hypothetical protein EZV61_03965 [Corallincola luteus]
MTPHQFPSHGKLQLSISEGLLIIEGEGPANMEMIMEYQARVQSYRELLRDNPWGSLVLLKGIPLLPIEAKNAMITTIRHATTLNLVATAVVIADPHYATTVESFWTSIYENTELPYAFFTNIDEAKQWLHHMISQSQRNDISSY